MKTDHVPSSNPTAEILTQGITKTSVQATELQVGLGKYPCTNLGGGGGYLESLYLSVFIKQSLISPVCFILKSHYGLSLISEISGNLISTTKICKRVIEA